MIEVNTQSSIKINDIYFDPFKIDEELHDARIIFITHPHYDHFDVTSIKKVMNESTVFIVPKDQEILNKLRGYNVVQVEPGFEYNMFNIKFKTVAAYNIDSSFHKKEYGWLGYVLYLDRSYYIMGDTDDIKEAYQVKCDYLFIPIGGTYTMDYKKAALLTNSIKPKVVIPIHYGTIVGKKDDGIKFSNLIDKEIEVKNIIVN